MKRPDVPTALAAVLTAILLAACGGGGSTPTPTPTPQDPPTSFTLAASTTQTLAGGKALAIEASVKAGDAVTWQLAAGSPGSISGTGGTGTYTPPATVAANTPVTITATSGGTTRTILLTIFPDPGASGLSRIAGAGGGRGLIDGSGTAARMGKVSAMASASDGTMVFGDGLANLSSDTPASRYAIRTLAPSGAVTTLLQTAEGFADGSKAQARLGFVLALAPAADGSVWFIDYYNARFQLRKLATDASVATVATTGEGIHDVRKMVLGKDGNLYIAAAYGVLKVTPAGVASILAGEYNREFPVPPADGTGLSARFEDLRDIAINAAGELLVADGSAVRKVTMAGVVTTLASGISYPVSLAVASDGSIDVLESQGSSYHIRRIGSGGTLSTLYTGSTPVGRLGFDLTSAVHTVRYASNGNLLLVREGQVDQLAGGSVRTLAGLEDDSNTEIDGDAASARFMAPSLLAADLAGNIYVVDDITPYGGHIVGMQGLSIRKISPAGTVSTVVAADSNFGRPSGIAADRSGNLYVTEATSQSHMTNPYGGALFKITPDGKRTLVAGLSVTTAGNTGVPVDGKGDAARFRTPVLAGIDNDGVVYINDYDGATPKVRKVTSDGTVSTVAALPAGMGAAWDGNRYGTDLVATAFRILPDGSKVLVAGVAGQRGTVLGSLPGGLDRPTAIVPTGPYSFAVVSGSAILKLVLPH